MAVRPTLRKASAVLLFLCLASIATRGGQASEHRECTHVPNDASSPPAQLTLDSSLAADVRLRRGYALMKLRRPLQALRCWLPTVPEHYGFHSKVVTDYGRALVVAAKRLPADAAVAKGWLHFEAIAAFDVGEWAGDSRAARLRGKVPDGQPGHTAAARSLYDGQRLRDAVAAHRRGDAVRAAQALCRTANDVSVDLAAPPLLPPELGVEFGAALAMTALQLRAAIAAMMVCGVVKLSGALDAAFVRSLAPKLAATVASGSGVDAVERWDRRREIKLPLQPPWTDPALAESSGVLAVVRTGLGRAVEIDTFSHVAASPGAPDQPWHTDVGAELFVGAAAFSERPQLPPHGYVAIVPVIDV